MKGFHSLRRAYALLAIMRRSIHDRLLPFAFCTLASSIHNRNSLDYFRCPRIVFSLRVPFSSTLPTHQISTQAFMKAASKGPIVLSLHALTKSATGISVPSVTVIFFVYARLVHVPSMPRSGPSQLWPTICLVGLDGASSRTCVTGGLGSQLSRMGDWRIMSPYYLVVGEDTSHSGLVLPLCARDIAVLVIVLVLHLFLCQSIDGIGILTMCMQECLLEVFGAGWCLGRGLRSRSRQDTQLEHHAASSSLPRPLRPRPSGQHF